MKVNQLNEKFVFILGSLYNLPIILTQHLFYGSIYAWQSNYMIYQFYTSKSLISWLNTYNIDSSVENGLNNIINGQGAMTIFIGLVYILAGAYSFIPYICVEGGFFAYGMYKLLYYYFQDDKGFRDSLVIVSILLGLFLKSLYYIQIGNTGISIVLKLYIFTLVIFTDNIDLKLTLKITLVSFIMSQFYATETFDLLMLLGLMLYYYTYKDTKTTQNHLVYRKKIRLLLLNINVILVSLFIFNNRGLTSIEILFSQYFTLSRISLFLCIEFIIFIPIILLYLTRNFSLNKTNFNLSSNQLYLLIGLSIVIIIFQSIKLISPFINFYISSNLVTNEALKIIRTFFSILLGLVFLSNVKVRVINFRDRTISKSNYLYAFLLLNIIIQSSLIVLWGDFNIWITRFILFIVTISPLILFELSLRLFTYGNEDEKYVAETSDINDINTISITDILLLISLAILVINTKFPIINIIISYSILTMGLCYSLKSKNKDSDYMFDIEFYPILLILSALIILTKIGIIFQINRILTICVFIILKLFQILYKINRRNKGIVDNHSISTKINFNSWYTRKGLLYILNLIIIFSLLFSLNMYAISNISKIYVGSIYQNEQDAMEEYFIQEGSNNYSILFSDLRIINAYVSITGDTDAEHVLSDINIENQHIYDIFYSNDINIIYQAIYDYFFLGKLSLNVSIFFFISNVFVTDGITTMDHTYPPIDSNYTDLLQSMKPYFSTFIKNSEVVIYKIDFSFINIQLH